ncbi:molybdate ABC transporter substrate-binding protein [Paenibacillus sp. D2_2]|uniref:molybdate ABC transporter substrate-binding protein n=1 Tax=Paenibacillus sp. D2_2 TaxID=3073092 RepID=UPI0028159AD6|nr:molybdate ABC transporter substrate-binding protein [Paenibacillus sp. D2_2]WMT39804.1 molybdate ABC transporter substrate-binding protein [Paenibacillus sp. D2_2]
MNKVLTLHRRVRLFGWLGSLLLCAVLLVSCSTAGSTSTNAPGSGADATGKVEPVTLIVSAAASLKDSLEELTPQFEQEHQGVTVVYNYGASGSLQKQIEQGAPADIFLSAGQKQMNALIESGHIAAEQSFNLLKNSLVVIVPDDAKIIPDNLNGLASADIKTLALGEPEVVPAGMYAKESLEHEQLWDQLSAKMVFTKDVTQVLTYIESGNADAGLVYLSDAKSSQKVKTAFTVDDSYHQPIVYPAGIVSATKHKAEAEAFLQFLRETDAREIFVKHGFVLAE